MNDFLLLTKWKFLIEKYYYGCEIGNREILILKASGILYERLINLSLCIYCNYLECIL